MAKQKWSIQQLKQAMSKDLSRCSDSFERGNCKAVCLKEIKDRAIELKETRSLTENEANILSSLGICL